MRKRWPCCRMEGEFCCLTSVVIDSAYVLPSQERIIVLSFSTPLSRCRSLFCFSNPLPHLYADILLTFN